MKETIQYLQKLLPAEQFVVTGSYAMNQMGLPTGKINDLDIIVINPTETSEKILKQMHESTPQQGYPEEMNMYCFEVLKTKINVWVQQAIIPVVWNSDKTIALSTIDGIVKAKKSYMGLKHILQLKNLGEFFYKQQYLDNFIGRVQKRLSREGSDAVMPMTTIDERGM